MPYYRTCPYCGANLDPGERCGCRDNKNAPASATNTDKGGVERIEETVSIPYDSRNAEDLQV